MWLFQWGVSMAWLITFISIAVTVLLSPLLLSRSVPPGHIAYIVPLFGKAVLWFSTDNGKRFWFARLGGFLQWRAQTDILFCQDDNYRDGHYCIQYAPQTVSFDAYQAAEVHVILKVRLQLSGEEDGQSNATDGAWSLAENKRLIRMMTAFKTQEAFYQSVLYPIVRQALESSARNFDLKALFFDKNGFSNYMRDLEKKLLDLLDRPPLDSASRAVAALEEETAKRSESYPFLHLLKVNIIAIKPNEQSEQRLRDFSEIEHKRRLSVSKHDELRQQVSELTVENEALLKEVSLRKNKIEELKKALEELGKPEDKGRGSFR